MLLLPMRDSGVVQELVAYGGTAVGLLVILAMTTGLIVLLGYFFERGRRWQASKR